MELKDIKDLIKTISNSNIKSFEIKNNDDYIKIENSVESSVENSNVITTAKKVESNKKSLDDEVSLENEENLDDENIIYIKSPIVGTFYSKPSPDKEPFVKVGDKVKKGDTICIIEAMKLMNDIDAEADGEITDVCVKDGDMVEYGQVLFKQRTNSSSFLGIV